MFYGVWLELGEKLEPVMQSAADFEVTEGKQALDRLKM